MTTSPVFKNLGKFIEVDEKKIGKGIKVVIRYTQPNYQDPSKVWEHGQWEDKISEELLGKLSDLTPGQEYCVQTIKNEAGYPDLYDVSPSSDVPPKATGGAYQKKSSGAGNWQPKDDTGIAVGAAWTNAIEILKLEGGAPAGESTVDIVDKLAWDILQRKLAHEKKLRAAKAKDAPLAEEVKKEEKPMSKLEQMKAKKAQPKKEEGQEEQELIDDAKLDDIEF